MSNAQDNKAIVRRWNEEFWGKNYNLEIVDELAASYMLFNHSLHTPRVGREPIKAFMAGFRAAFPDLRFVQIPMHRGHLLRFDRGQATDLMAATIPI
jgi:hypothetical protein